jgi:hypothetical protein
MSEFVPQRRNVEEWQASQLRITLFASPMVPPLNPAGWWGLVTEAEKDRIEDNPKIGKHVEEGQSLGGSLSLTIVANRVDWVLSHVLDIEKGLHDVPKVGAYLSVCEDFLLAILRWLPSAPPIQRLAFGGRLMLPVPSREESYRLLGAYLPFSPDPITSSDLRYQINRPRVSHALTDLKVNRLQVWSSGFFRLQSGAAAKENEMILHEQHAVSLELDINTEAQFMGSLPAERLPDLLRELAQYATELAAEGDRQ